VRKALISPNNVLDKNLYILFFSSRVGPLGDIWCGGELANN